MILPVTSGIQSGLTAHVDKTRLPGSLLGGDHRAWGSAVPRGQSSMGWLRSLPALRFSCCSSGTWIRPAHPCPAREGVQDQPAHPLSMMPLFPTGAHGGPGTWLPQGGGSHPLDTQCPGAHGHCQPQGRCRTANVPAHPEGHRTQPWGHPGRHRAGGSPPPSTRHTEWVLVVSFDQRIAPLRYV